jgi:ketol-acid reductoisomerase
VKTNSVDNARLIEVNEAIRTHPVEIVGKKLRGYMTDMKAIVEAAQ